MLPLLLAKAASLSCCSVCHLSFCADCRVARAPCLLTCSQPAPSTVCWPPPPLPCCLQALQTFELRPTYEDVFQVETATVEEYLQQVGRSSGGGGGADTSSTVQQRTSSLLHNAACSTARCSFQLHPAFCSHPRTPLPALGSIHSLATRCTR